MVAITLTRLNAELKVGGFAVVFHDAPSNPNTTYADVRVAEHDDRVLLDVTSRSESAKSHVMLEGVEKEIGPLALQAVEFLRAGLVPSLSSSASTQPPHPEPPSELPRPVTQPKVGRWYLDLGGTLLTNVGQKDTLVLLSTGVGYALAERLALGVSADIPLNAATLTADRGSADYRQWLGELRGDYSFWRSSQGEVAWGTLLGVARTAANGRPDPPSQAEHPALWSLTLGATLRAELKLSALVALQAEARVLSMSPSPVVAVFEADRRLGAPSVLFNLGARVGGR